MARRSKRPIDDVPEMTIRFTGGDEVDVTFKNWKLLTPGKIERSFVKQIKAWELKRIQEVNAVNKEAFQESLTPTKEKVDA